jgi:small-conductance mechanosensitive channel
VLFAAGAPLLAALLAAPDHTNVVTTRLTVWDWVVAAGVFAGGIVVGWIVKRVLSKAVRRGDSEYQAADVVGRFAALFVALGALTYALIALGVRLGPFLGALGIGGVAIAFAAQSILSNFLASIILQIRRPCRRGEQVRLHDIDGTVEEINFRTVVLRTYEGERVFVPSAKVLEAPIVNHTRLGRRRTTLPVGVSYDADLEIAQKVLLEAVRRADGVLAHPPAEAWVEQFGPSSVDMAVRFWHAPDVASLWRVRHAVAVEVKRALDDAGIEIPFAQLVVREAGERDSVT